jgi:hypothetical protein
MGLNFAHLSEPVRMVCAIPRASLRSVLFGIAPIAVLLVLSELVPNPLT